MPDTMTLHDLTSSPWCPKCGWTDHDVEGVDVCCGCGSSTCKPNIFTRLPESRPEGLEWKEKATLFSGGVDCYVGWTFDEYPGTFPIFDAHAEKLCVGHIVQTVAKLYGFDGFEEFLKLWVEVIHCTEGVPGDAETCITAMHRLCDSQESKP